MKPLVLLLLLLTACDSHTPSDPFTVTYAPSFDPDRFVEGISNPYYPLAPGTRWEYAAQTEDGAERIVVEVLTATRTVAGVQATVVRDRVYLNDALIEDTFDWYAQDADGNVWYLGEDSREMANGAVVSTAGSWEAGVDGARAGIIMPAHPQVGQAYQQEFYAGEAEDRGRVLATGATVAVPAGTFTDCVQTEDTTPLEPDVEEHKYHCRDVGTALEVDLADDVRVELTARHAPDTARSQTGRDQRGGF